MPFRNTLSDFHVMSLDNVIDKVSTYCIMLVDKKREFITRFSSARRQQNNVATSSLCLLFIQRVNSFDSYLCALLFQQERVLKNKQEADTFADTPHQRQNTMNCERQQAVTLARILKSLR